MVEHRSFRLTTQPPIIVPKWVIVALAFLPIVTYWITPVFVGSISHRLDLVMYLGNWTAVGGWIGFALSGGRVGVPIGAILGAFLSLVLML